MIRGQQVLRPTVVSMYNYMQPIVAALVSILLGLAVLDRDARGGRGADLHGRGDGDAL